MQKDTAAHCGPNSFGPMLLRSIARSTLRSASNAINGVASHQHVPRDVKIPSVVTSLRSNSALAAPSSSMRCSSVLSAVSRPVIATTSAVMPAMSTRRFFSSDASGKPNLDMMRNIGISAHIDSGKTTLTERILFYSGKIKAMHEVRGNDGVGATMDSMDLEREKGITIQSAATYISWNNHHVNIIDTPGHVDFTIEVERALRVLDGAVMVLCGVGGVQSQTITVDRQMRRYNVPRLAFINKLDRMGANPFKVLDMIKHKLRLNSAAIQIPIGVESEHKGVVDLVTMKAVYFEGAQGTERRVTDIPAELREQAAVRRKELLEVVSNVDDELAELFLAEQEPTVEQLKAAIRRATISLKFVPLLMGSAYKNKGVQALLDAVTDYLPNPKQVENVALNLEKGEERTVLSSEPSKPLVGLAFKLDQSRFGQLTYMRIYQGSLAKGGTIVDQTTGKRVKVPRLVRMHSNHMADVDEAGAGDIVAMFGVDCASGTTFTDGTCRLSMTSMFVPDAVLSLAVRPKNRSDDNNFSKALNRFQKEDPTFRVHFDSESKETILSGMGELHLEIYLERMRREYKVDTVSGAPRVNYREAITRQAPFEYLHKKQSGGSGQYGGVKGYIEPLPEGHPTKLEFQNTIIGTIIPSEFIPAIEKGFREACEKSNLTGHPIEGVRFVLEDGKAHPVDSNEIAFRLAAMNGFRQAFEKAGPQVLEPIMNVEIETPNEFQSSVIALLSKRRGAIRETQLMEAESMKVLADVPLSQMFGFSTDLRSCTMGKAEYSMEYTRMEAVEKTRVNELAAAYQAHRLTEQSGK